MSFFNRFRLDSLLFEVTPRCNQRCPHCYNVWKGDTAYGEQELSTDRARALIAKAIRECRCRQFTFTGGEPTLREDLEVLVREAARRAKHVALITNGTLLPESRIESLLDAGVGLFELPLNGGDPATHDRMAGFPGAFDKVTRAAVDIRSQGGDLALVFVATRDNIEAWPDALDLGIALGARGFLLNRYNAGGECSRAPESLMPTLDQLKKAFQIAEDRAVRFKVGISAGVPIQPCLIDTSHYPHVGFGYCGAGTDRSYTTLDPLGFVRPCNHSGLKLGNLFDSSLKELLRSPAQKAFYAARPAFCVGCRMEGECQGGCKAAAEVCLGDCGKAEPFLQQNLGAAKHI